VALAAAVDPALVAADRAQLVSLLTSNLLGQNAPVNFGTGRSGFLNLPQGG
jgi:PPE-repeat protein